MPDEILFSIEDQIATITLNRPQKLNAVTPDMAEAIVTHVERCNRDDGVRCVIVTGAGERSFCAGSDIGELDRKSTRLNSSHGYISYAVFCLKKKSTTTSVSVT